jgi:hypothetical protein
MPLIRIDAIEGRTQPEIQAVLDANIGRTSTIFREQTMKGIGRASPIIGAGGIDDQEH